MNSLSHEPTGGPSSGGVSSPGATDRAPHPHLDGPDPLLRVQPREAVGYDAGGLLERCLGLLDQEARNSVKLVEEQDTVVREGS
jgi:hypothetical protein